MINIPASRIMEFSPQDFIHRLKSNVTVTYDDGVAVTHTAKELAVNRYVYELIPMVPNIGYQSKYSIHNYYSGGMYVSKTINGAFEAILKDAVATYSTTYPDRKWLEAIYEKMYLIMEDIYNYIIYANLDYVSSLDITDFLQIQMNPELIEAIDQVRVKNDLESISNTYAVLDKIIRTDESLHDNPIARGYISGSISANQVKQLLASRGFVTEIDSSIFKYPIASSFVLGLDNIYELATESRSGAKALYLSNRAISMSEYFAREMQLMTMHVERLSDVDCGNREVIDWHVRKDDLHKLLGKHYFEGDKEYVISEDSKHLIGTNIRLRNAIRCKAPNKREICTACFGGLSANVPMHSNLGHLSLTVLTERISQLILSTKHITTTASADAIVLTDDMKELLLIKNKDSYAFRANTLNRRGYQYRLVISQDEAKGITDLDMAEDVYKLNISRLTTLNVVYFVMEDPDGKITSIPLHMKQGARYGNLTYDFLSHIKKHGCTVDEASDNYVIDLTGWNTGVPFVVLPQVEFSYVDLAKAIKDEFKYMKKGSRTPEAFLHTIYNIVNDKLSVNIAILEVIIYAATVADKELGDFDMARGSVNAEPTKLMNIMTRRSVGGAYAWEHVNATLLSPNSYYGRNAVNHILDVALKPNETLLEHYGKL